MHFTWPHFTCTFYTQLLTPSMISCLVQLARFTLPMSVQYCTKNHAANMSLVMQSSSNLSTHTHTHTHTHTPWLITQMHSPLENEGFGKAYYH